MMMLWRGCGLGLVALLLTGCASVSPVRHYLVDVPDVATPVPAPAAAPRVEILDLRVARHLDRRGLAFRSGDTEWRYPVGHEWAAALPEQLGRALATHLVAQLGHADIAPPRRRTAQPPDVRLLVDVERFECAADGHAVVAARWQVHSLRDGQRTAHSAQIRADAPVSSATPAALAADLSRLYAELARRIGASLAAGTP